MNHRCISLDPKQQQLKTKLDHIKRCLQTNRQPSHSLYIYGPVGRGKSLLMDDFYQHLNIKGKTRLHYHHFMRKVHQALNEQSGIADPLHAIAVDWAQQYRVLCLDEFMVEDIADAMILGTLWRHLFALDVILVTTSNNRPDQLYHNGLQRERFLPTIALLESYCDIVNLDHGIDYRRQQGVEGLPYFTQRKGNQYWHPQLLSNGSATASALDILGRSIECLGHSQTTAIFKFSALCEGPRSQRDYMELAQDYQAICILEVPCFSYQTSANSVQGIEDNYQRRPSESVAVSQYDNEARRFMALVDECYDQGCLVIVDTANTTLADAAKHPDELYQAHQLATPFQRCASRLLEMQTWPLPD